MLALFCLFACAGPSPDPPLADLHLFPPPAFVRAGLDFNYDFGQVIAYRRACDHRHWEYWTQVQSENNQLREVYDALDDAQSPYADECFRRQRLGRLRTLLGNDDYYAGRLPPCVPIWRFEVIP